MLIEELKPSLPQVKRTRVGENIVSTVALSTKLISAQYEVAILSDHVIEETLRYFPSITEALTFHEAMVKAIESMGGYEEGLFI